MIEKRYWVNLVIITLQFYLRTADSVLYITKYEYIGLRNVWHEAEKWHTDINAGDPDVVGKSKVLQLCSNYCTLAKTDCDGFYISNSNTTSCHLVDHDHPQTGNIPYTVGHGEDTDREYYVKRQVGGVQNLEKPEELIPPCDQEDIISFYPVDDPVCVDLRSGDQMKYYNCTNCNGCTYLKTVSQLVTDVRCADEDRLIQCELQNENVTANIDLNSDYTKHVFYKAFTAGSAQGMVASAISGTPLQWLEAILKITEGAQEVSRLIIRTLGNDVDQIKRGRVILYRENPVDSLSRSFNFEQPDDCVVAINFKHSGFNATERNVIENTSKIRIEIDEMRTEIKNKRGFKADLFIKKKLAY